MCPLLEVSCDKVQNVKITLIQFNEILNIGNF